MAATVTIDKAYFETLLRRAEFHTSEGIPTLPLPLETVTIPKADYDDLSRLAGEYNTLREALFRGGLNTETLELLINGNSASPKDVNDPPALSTSENASDSGGVTFDEGVNLSFPSNTPGFSQDHPHAHTPFNQPGYNTRSLGHDVNGSPVSPSPFGKGTPAANSMFLENDRHQLYGRSDKRTICFSNLSERATHKDIVGVVQGGMLLDVYMRTQDRSASISFVNGTSALDFFNHAKRNDIYIAGKRVSRIRPSINHEPLSDAALQVEIRWNERQFILPNHVARKLASGASRNLVLHNVHDGITDQRLREDLDHIHNLVVIDVVFQKSNIYVSLNSVHNALFARTCLMSRGTYKGVRIDFDEDKCAAPVPKPQYTPKRETPRLPTKKAMPVVNRFQLLNMDASSDDESGKEDRGVASYAGRPHHLEWPGTSIAA
ncbi:MAG: hypothetical protein M1837_003622 [Sclerophora amabilis]|nr:MAG: hypothetical protein M1837_003622 [Sclerophora amabilis]